MKQVKHCYMVTFTTPRTRATMQVITADTGTRLYDTIRSEIAEAGKTLDDSAADTIIVQMVFDCGEVDDESDTKNPTEDNGSEG